MYDQSENLYEERQRVLDKYHAGGGTQKPAIVIHSPSGRITTPTGQSVGEEPREEPPKINYTSEKTASGLTKYTLGVSPEKETFSAGSGGVTISRQVYDRGSGRSKNSPSTQSTATNLQNVRFTTTGGTIPKRPPLPEALTPEENLRLTDLYGKEYEKDFQQRSYYYNPQLPLYKRKGTSSTFAEGQRKLNYLPFGQSRKGLVEKGLTYGSFYFGKADKQASRVTKAVLPTYNIKEDSLAPKSLQYAGKGFYDYYRESPLRASASFGIGVGIGIATKKFPTIQSSKIFLGTSAVVGGTYAGERIFTLSQAKTKEEKAQVVGQTGAELLTFGAGTKLGTKGFSGLYKPELKYIKTKVKPYIIARHRSLKYAGKWKIPITPAKESLGFKWKPTKGFKATPPKIKTLEEAYYSPSKITQLQITPKPYDPITKLRTVGKPSFKWNIPEGQLRHLDPLYKMSAGEKRLMHLRSPKQKLEYDTVEGFKPSTTGRPFYQTRLDTGAFQFKGILEGKVYSEMGTYKPIIKKSKFFYPFSNKKGQLGVLETSQVYQKQPSLIYKESSSLISKSNIKPIVEGEFKLNRFVLPTSKQKNKYSLKLLSIQDKKEKQDLKTMFVLKPKLEEDFFLSNKTFQEENQTLKLRTKQSTKQRKKQITEQITKLKITSINIPKIILQEPTTTKEPTPKKPKEPIPKTPPPLSFTLPSYKYKKRVKKSSKTKKFKFKSNLGYSPELLSVITNQKASFSKPPKPKKGKYRFSGLEQRGILKNGTRRKKYSIFKQ